MNTFLCMAGSATVQFISVFIIFILVLVITYYTTRWVANFQKEKSTGENVKVLETTRIAQNKFIQIVEIGDKCIAYAVCKDSVTVLAEISKDSLKLSEDNKEAFSFKDFLNKAREDEKDK
ncbi:MAG: flagellar biosynthetic protein FliO [Lachnospiraceae bacterium]|nr:flagellar biosynthetic protein FliO [Lachnospiraceae bacterium]